MENPIPRQDSLCIAFEGDRRVASGAVRQVAIEVKQVVDRGPRGPVLVFDQRTSQPVEFDLRGTVADVAERLEHACESVSAEDIERSQSDEPASRDGSKRRGRGRPKLGVIGREVTLLPRHWEWLSSRPGGASVTLRKLVDRARRDSAAADRQRLAQESAYRFMSAMAGNHPGFEEATRALFAADSPAFDLHSQPWPADVREHARSLAAPVFETDEELL